jgi:sporulation protein YqfC
MKKRSKYATSKIRTNKFEKYSDGLRQLVLSKNLPLEAVFHDSFVTVVGQSELWIENYKALLVYEEDNIVIQTKSYTIRVEGTNLIISHYMKEHMMIKGSISKISYL